MNNYYKTIIWDWNGTLLNDLNLCVDIANDILSGHTEQRLTVEGYKDVFKFPVAEYYEQIGVDFKKESYAQLTEKFMSSYMNQVKGCELHEGVSQTLNLLRKQALDQYILTASHKDVVNEMLVHFNIGSYFKRVEGLDNYRAHSKVDRGIKLIEQNKINRATTVLIGDTIHDYEVAQELGVACILIANGHQSKERLVDYTKQKILVLDKISEVFNQLKTSDFYLS